MFSEKLNRRLKFLFIILVIIFSVFTAVHYTQATMAAEDAPSLPSVSATGDAPNLSTGGSGLTINEGEVKISKDISHSTLAATVLAIVNYFIGFLGLLATLAFIYAGVLWVLSGGAEESITKARKIMTYAALGIIVVILSFSVVRFIAGSAGEATDNPGGGIQGPPPKDGTSCTISNNMIICGETSFPLPVGGTTPIPKDGASCVVSNNTVVCGESSFPIPKNGDTGAAGADGIQCALSDNGNGTATVSCAGTSFTIPKPKDGTSCGVKGNTITCTDNTTLTIPGGINGTNGRNGTNGTNGTNGKNGDPGKSATVDNTGKIDDLIKDIPDNLDTSKLSPEVKPKVDAALKKGAGGTGVTGLGNKISVLQKMLNDPNSNLTDDDKKIIENVIDALSKLKILRNELDDLRKNMPESKELISAYDEASGTLDDLINDPSNQVLFSRFDTKYKILKNLINKFPFVRAVIWATPASGSVPFTVQLDGLDSIDPTGGTISDYKWTYLDNSGSKVSLGSTPVVLHDFTEVNTYVIQLRAGTSNRDADGYKMAADGISTIRITANPPTSQVRFRVNGKDAGDILNMTLKEAQAGLSFDPSATTAAFGRTIVKYDWAFGDSSKETRDVPTTVVHTYDETGEYTVKLTVTDNIGIKDSGIVRLFIKAVAADILVTPASGDVNNTFTFAGVGSRSDDGIIRTYEWEIDDSAGKALTKNDQQSFSYKFSKPGTYYAVLTVTDIGGTKDRFNKTVIVNSRPPTANFTTSVQKSNHPNRVEFNAIDSYDPDEGDSITYSWDFDGDGVFDITDSKDVITTYDYQNTGEFRAKLQVQDEFGQHSQIEKNVSINSVLSADIIPGKRVGRVGEPMDFEAKSDNAVAYLWEFGDGQTQSTEDTKVSHTYNKAGKFTAKLNFFDKDDNSNTDTQTVLVGVGDEPLAFIDYDVDGRAPKMVEDLCGDGKQGAVVDRANKISFDARNSINTDGSSRLLSYDWKLPGGQRDSNKQTLFKFDEINREGECFSASLVVRDQVSGKLSAPDEVYFKVINELPRIKDFVITPPSSSSSYSASSSSSSSSSYSASSSSSSSSSYSASSSSSSYSASSPAELITPIKVKLKIVDPKDSDGTIKKYRWWYYREGFDQDKMGVHSTSTPETDMTITSFGEPDTVNRYYFVAEIVDNDNGVLTTQERFGETSYLDVKNGPNLSPVADFGVDKTTISVGDSITFSSKSYDPQGDVLPTEAFLWDFDGDGEFDDTSSGPQVNRQYNTPGEYNARLKVVYRGLSSSVTKTVFVDATQTLPQAAFTYTTDTVEGTKVAFDASSSRFDPSLTDTTLRYEWDFDVIADANGNSIKDDDVESTEVMPTHTYLQKGIYKVRLKAKDMLGMEGIVVRDINLNITEAERAKNSFYSIKVSSSKQALTTLDIGVIPATLTKGDSADLSVRVLNADGSPYNGKVFFEIAEGSGEITPNPVTASASKASAIFTSTEKGKTRIKVRATDTVYGELTEDAVITVK